MAEYEIRYNGQVDKWVVFEVLKSGRWKAKKQFDSETDAEKWVENKKKSKKKRKKRKKKRK